MECVTTTDMKYIPTLGKSSKKLTSHEIKIIPIKCVKNPNLSFVLQVIRKIRQIIIPPFPYTKFDKFITPTCIFNGHILKTYHSSSNQLNNE